MEWGLTSCGACVFVCLFVCLRARVSAWVRCARARGVERGVLHLDALHAVKDADSAHAAAHAAHAAAALERARGAGVTSGVKHHVHHHHAEARGALGHAVRGGHGTRDPGSARVVDKIQMQRAAKV